jgi:hypothetical protein
MEVINLLVIRENLILWFIDIILGANEDKKKIGRP